MFLLHSALHCLQSCADGQSLGTVRKQSPQADYSMPPLLLVSQARFLVVSGLQVFFFFGCNCGGHNASLSSHRWQPRLDERGWVCDEQLTCCDSFISLSSPSPSPPPLPPPLYPSFPLHLDCENFTMAEASLVLASEVRKTISSK